MTTINLREFYYWYRTNEYIEVSDEVACLLRAGKQEDVNHWRRMKRNKANYSLNTEGGIEHEICEHEPSPDMVLDLMEQYRRLCCALNALPEVQGRRVYLHYLLNITQTEIAAAEGVSVNAVNISIQRGLDAMKILWRKF